MGREEGLSTISGFLIAFLLQTCLTGHALALIDGSLSSE